ncbi:hypothetical protein N9N67_10580 [Bacteriovoracaceae bacterium]|nr:hypothetical protein [Bacteriovoracaceae bacterium]
MGQIQEFYFFVARVKQFLAKANFLEIITPPMVENPGVESHIHPYQIYQAQNSQKTSYYLNTSPEFKLKECLARDPELQNIYSLNYAFRDEPQSPIHRSQFLMLEWYRVNQTYKKIMQDCEDLISYLNPKFNSMENRTVSSLFQEFLNFDPTDFSNTKELKLKIKKDIKEVILPKDDLAWDDYFFLIWLNCIEPKLKNYSAIIVKEYPAQLSAFAQINKSNPKVCNRFELFINGIEIANCYQEVTDPIEMENRIQELLKIKYDSYKYNLPYPQLFIEQFKKGYPPSSGIALGVQRLYGALAKSENIFLLED